MTVPTTAARAEARASLRHPCDVPASCRPPSDWRRRHGNWPGYLRNVSSGGMRLVLERRFEPGAALAVEVPGTDADDSSSTLLARVVHVRQHRGAWALGCSFVSPLSDDEIQALTRPESLADITVRAAGPGGRVVERLIHKLNGAGRWPLRPGRKIGLRLRGANGGGPLVKVRVDACHTEGGRRILECTFLDARSAGAAL